MFRCRDRDRDRVNLRYDTLAAARWSGPKRVPRAALKGVTVTTGVIVLPFLSLALGKGA